jgi:hypothetical protein
MLHQYQCKYHKAQDHQPTQHTAAESEIIVIPTGPVIAGATFTRRASGGVLLRVRHEFTSYWAPYGIVPPETPYPDIIVGNALKMNHKFQQKWTPPQPARISSP